MGGKTVHILYWDIDGTILNTGRAGLYAIEDVYRELCGDAAKIPEISAGGRTDNYICQQLLYKGTGVMPTDAEVSSFCRRYERQLLKWLKKKRQDGTVFANVRDILDFFVQREDFKLLLLTGNSAYGAKLKLEVFGLDHYFDFDHSGFACQYYYRNELAQNACAIAKRTWGNAVETMFVTGDTPYDIECGKAIGAKTISVATGHYGYDELRSFQPWKQLRTLPSAAEFLRLLSVE